jgi:hypothetical protein
MRRNRGIAIVLAVTVLLATGAAGSEIVVGPQDSVQAAVNGASDGDTILVTGTHAEQILIEGKSLTLLAGPGGATLVPPPAPPLVTFNLVVPEDFGQPFVEPFTSIVTVKDGESSIVGFVIDGERLYTGLLGVSFISAGGAVRGCTIQNLCVPDFPANGGQDPGGMCIRVMNEDAATLRTVDISGCLLTQWDYLGLHASGQVANGVASVLVRVEDCVVLGSGAHDNYWQYGLYTTTGVIGQFRRNLVRDMVHSGDGFGEESTAIWTFFGLVSGAPAVAEDNVVLNAQQGIMIFGINDSVHVARNFVAATTSGLVRSAQGIQVLGGTGDVSVCDNNVVAQCGAAFAANGIIAVSNGGSSRASGNTVFMIGDGPSAPFGIDCESSTSDGVPVGPVEVFGNDVTVLPTPGGGLETGGATGIAINANGGAILANSVRFGFHATPGTDPFGGASGILVLFGNGNTFSDNLIRGPGGPPDSLGIALVFSSNDVVIHNVLADFEDGIVLFEDPSQGLFDTGETLAPNTFTRVHNPIVEETP